MSYLWTYAIFFWVGHGSGPPHNMCIIIMLKAILRNSVFNLRTIFPHHEVHLILSTQGHILEMVGMVCAIGLLMSHYAYVAGKKNARKEPILMLQETNTLNSLLQQILGNVMKC